MITGLLSPPTYSVYKELCFRREVVVDDII